MKAKLDFNITGFIIAIILVGMFSMIFMSTLSEMGVKYNTTVNNTFAKYDSYSKNITDITEKVQNSTDINSQSGLLGVFEAWFYSGFQSLKLAASSMNIFGQMMNDVSTDLPFFASFKMYIIAIVIVILVIGVLVSVLVKWRL
jgi:hypothetical protein